MQPIRLAERLGEIGDYWHPRIVGELNGQHVKLVKLLGEFPWHHHADEDELFLVLQGAFRMEYRDNAGAERAIDLQQGELLIVPRGTEHRPVAATEAHVLLFEPAGTLNTGNVQNEFTVYEPPNLVSPPEARST